MSAKAGFDEQVSVPVSVLARMVEALDRIDARASAPAPKPYTVTDQIADHAEAIRNSVRPWTIHLVGCEHIPTGYTFDIELQPSDRFPLGKIFCLRNCRASESRVRTIYEGLIGGQDRSVQVALIRRRYPEEATDNDGLDTAIDGVDQNRLAAMDRDLSRDLRFQVWQQLVLPAQRDLIGRPIHEIRHLLAPLPKYVVVDHDPRCQWPLPPQE